MSQEHLPLLSCCGILYHVLVAGSGKGSAAGGESLFSHAYRKGVLMGCLLFVFQQFSGINAIVYFSSSVFKQVCAAAPQPQPRRCCG